MYKALSAGTSYFKVKGSYREGIPCQPEGTDEKIKRAGGIDP